MLSYQREKLYQTYQRPTLVFALYGDRTEERLFCSSRVYC